METEATQKSICFYIGIFINTNITNPFFISKMIK